MAEAERIEKKFKYGVEESDQTHFEQYAENWLKRQETFFKDVYKRQVSRFGVYTRKGKGELCHADFIDRR